MILLSVDWDYFFPVPHDDHPGLYDWNSMESPMFMGPDLWTLREANFQQAGLSRPTVNTDWESFWHWFPIAEDAEIFYGESHSWAANEFVANGVDEVWSYDAHHDLGYNFDKILAAFEGQYECENWLLHYVKQKIPVHIRYPHWRQEGEDGGPAQVLRLVSDISWAAPMEIDEEIERIFVCRSGAWVPPWCDEDYLKFVESCPASTKMDLGPKLGWPSTPRIYDQEAVDKLVESMNALITGAQS